MLASMILDAFVIGKPSAPQVTDPDEPPYARRRRMS
jgi:hypothetical protein